MTDPVRRLARIPIVGRALKRVLRGGFVRNVAIIAGSAALAQGVVVVATPVVTRLYSPADYGVLSVFSSLLAVLATVSSLRYDFAVPVAEDDESAASLVALSFVVTLLVCVLISAGVLALGAPIAALIGSPELAHYLWYLPLGVLAAGIYRTLSAWATRQNVFSLIARTSIVQSFALAGVQIGLGILRFGPAGLILGHILGQAAGSGSLFKLFAREKRDWRGLASLQSLRRVAIRHKKFPLYSTFSGLLNSAGLQLPVLLLGGLYGLEVAGLFALGNRIISIPLSLIGRSVAKVYFGVAPKLAREDPNRLLKLFRKTARSLLAIGSIPIAGLAIAAPALFGWAFGETWVEAGRYVQLVAVLNVFRFAATPLSQTFNVLERQELAVVWDSLRLVLNVGAMWTAHSLGYGPSVAIALYSIVMTCYYASLLLAAPRLIRAATSSH